jgi:flagellar biosynthesis chaperone FliJ
VMGEATREVRAIEVLHTRMLAEQKREADKREQSELDEASSRKGKPQ